MDANSFNEVLPQFNSILVSHINKKVLNNYVRDSPLGRYIFLSVETSNGPVDLTVSYDAFYQVPVFFYLVNGHLDTSRGNIVEMHPILQTPYQMVHPCETASTMSYTKWKGALQYLVIWFGLYVENVLTELQLRVPSEVMQSA